MKHGGNTAEMAERYHIPSESLLDFSANINPLGTPKSVKRALRQGIEAVQVYPDNRYVKLTRAIADYHHCAEEHVFVGNGAADIIFSVGRQLPICKMLLLAPTFVEYQEAFAVRKTAFVYYDLAGNNFQFSVAAFLLLAETENVDGICLCNPNNPTGQLLTKNELLQVMTFCQGREIPLIIDEAFMDFTLLEEDSMIGELNSYNQLFIVRSLTKMYAIPGLRLGYLLTSNHTFLKTLLDHSPPWRINVFADYAGRQMVADTQHVKETVNYVQKEREYLQLELAALSEMTVYPSQTNYLFFKSIETNLQAKMIEKGLLIRDCSNFHGLSAGYYRIAVRTHLENQQLVAALKEIFYERGNCEMPRSLW